MDLNNNNSIKINAVIFDLDDTLYDERIYLSKFFLFLSKKYKFNFYYRKYFFKKKIYKKKDFIRFILIKEKKFSYLFHKKIFNEYKVFKTKIFLNSYAKKIFIFLKKKNVKLFILTNGHPYIQNNKIKYLGIKKYFNNIFFARKLYKDKPSLKTFKIVLQKIKMLPEQVLMIGDEYYTDIVGARKLGIKTLFLNNSSKIYPYGEFIFNIKSLKEGFLMLKKIIT
jgi:putative hydrolase of the HAD superfamily